jgi:glycogen debranching enzyme
MAADEAAFDPLSYHCGSVWPHDNAIIAAGLARTGNTDAFHRVALALLDAATTWQGRLPELFCGLARDDIPVPVPFPTSCSPQAWAAASPLLLLRSLLGLDPDVPRGIVTIDPVLPGAVSSLAVHGLRLWDRRLDVRVSAGGTVEVDGLEGLRLADGGPTG